MTALAKFHAAHWMSEESVGISPRIWPMDRLPKVWQASYQRNRDEFLSKFGDLIEDEKISQLDQAQKSALDSGSSAVEAQKLALQRDYTDAYNSGDTDKMFEVQDKLSRLTAQQSEYDRQKTYNEQRAEQQAAQPQQPVVQQQQPVQQEPEPKAVEWARKNKWFGQDEAMTGAAYAIHNRLVNTESYDTTSDEYFSELDRRLKDAFPDKFKRKSNSSPVAAVTSRGATSKRVKLNQAQLDVCKRLGVTPEQYARFVDV